MNVEQSELDILQFFKSIIDAAIQVALAYAFPGAAPPGALSQWMIDKGYSEAQISMFALCTCGIDPEESFDMFSAEGASTPRIFVELDNHLTSDNSAQGTEIKGDIFFKLAVMVIKNGRPFLTYKAEVVDTIAIIKALFAAERNKAIDVHEAQFNDFPLPKSNLPASGAIFSFSVPSNTRDYRVAN